MYIIQGGVGGLGGGWGVGGVGRPNVSTHTLGLIPLPCFIFEGCRFADGILYLFVRGCLLNSSIRSMAKKQICGALV